MYQVSIVHLQELQDQLVTVSREVIVQEEHLLKHRTQLLLVISLLMEHQNRPSVSQVPLLLEQVLRMLVEIALPVNIVKHLD